MNKAVSVEGSQFGDEGKGKIVDYLAEDADVVVRYQGGDNAGHSVVVDGVRHALRSLPSGIFNPKAVNVIGNGCVVNPSVLLQEIEGVGGLESVEGRLLISSAAHVNLPYHRLLDAAYESNVSKGNKIGTTGRGIGPCYADKARRIGIRMGDLLHPDYLKDRLCSMHQIHKIELEAFGFEVPDFDEVYNTLLRQGELLRPYITDTSLYISNAIHSGKRVLFEGAQGSLLDIDHGTYPFVTSSSPTAVSIPAGAGIAPSDIGKVVAIVKAYQTRVGEGPMPTEQDTSWGDKIREKGHEYGVVTKRPRRVGYLDLPFLRRTIRISGATDLAVTLFDVLEEIDDLKICTSYMLDGEEILEPPVSTYDVCRITPVYREFKTIPAIDPETVRSLDDLPSEAREYLGFISDELNVPISILSLGPDRKDTVLLREIY